MKEHSFDLVKECTYQGWDAETTVRVQNWIEIVDALQDPALVTQPQVTEQKPAETEDEQPAVDVNEDFMTGIAPF